MSALELAGSPSTDPKICRANSHNFEMAFNQVPNQRSIDQFHVLMILNPEMFEPVGAVMFALGKHFHFAMTGVKVMAAINHLDLTTSYSSPCSPSYRRPLFTSLRAMLFLCLTLVMAWCPMRVGGQGLGMSHTLSIPEVEMEALRDLYEATSGPDWTIFGVPWNVTGAHNPCEEGWEGLACTCLESVTELVFPYRQIGTPGYAYYSSFYDDGLGVLGAPCHVSKLFLGFTHLQGTLPTSLGRLLFLTRMHMEQNHIYGSLPTSLGHLTAMQELNLGKNSLTGSILTSLGKITGMLALDLFTNSLTGSIPTSLGHLTMMEVLQLSANSLTGIIPSPLGYLTAMERLDLNTNSLTGPIPTSLGYLTTMQILVLNTNSLTQSLPTSLGRISGMQILDLFANSLTGPIPTSLGYLTGMQQLFLYVNSFTGSMPTSLGFLTELRLLILNTNSLTGTIPSSLGHLTGLQYLQLDSNCLTGSIPTALGNISALRRVQMNDNALSGEVMNVFSRFQSVLSVMDLSGNRFTGDMSNLFQFSTLNTLAMVENCFTGTLPSEICKMTSLQLLALDGLHTAPTCQDRFFPTNDLITTYDLPPSSSMRGTIPSCLFSMPNLTTLHLSGNGFTGSIDDITTIGVLMDLNLAHNILTGSIPHWMQEQQWTSLKLGYNRFSGTLASSFGALGANSSLALNVNRLSGDIPSSVKQAHNINILRGNLFGCDISRESLPSNDPDAYSYECGSNAANSSLIAWGVICCCWVVVGSLLFKFESQFRKHILGHILSSTIKLFPGDFDTIVSRDSRVSSTSHLAPLALKHIKIIALSLAGVCCIVLMPLYGALSSYYRTHSYVYTWAVSSSYLSGSVAAGAVIIIWAILGAVICLGIPNIIYEADTISPTHRVRVSHSLRDISQIKWAMEICVLSLMAVVNLATIGGANVVYIFLITSPTFNSASATIIAAEIALGVIKAGWNSIVLPNSFEHFVEWKRSLDGQEGNSHGEDDDTGQLMLHSLVVLNNILLPCIVEALVGPNCFYNVIFQAPAIDASYTYTYCAPYESAVNCLQYTSTTVSVFYSPPFIYNYQCASALLANYTAVYVYSVTFSSLIVPIARWLVSRACAGDSVKSDESVESVESTGFSVIKFTAQVMNLLAIGVTFGVAFPLLSIVVLVAVYVETSLAQDQLMRFVNMAQSEAEAGERKAAMDGALKKTVSSLWLLVPLSTSFNAFFVFDILGDEVGWEQALGGMFAVMIILPVLLWGGHKLWRQVGLGGNIAVGTSKIPDALKQRLQCGQDTSCDSIESDVEVNAAMEMSVTATPYVAMEVEMEWMTATFNEPFTRSDMMSRVSIVNSVGNVSTASITCNCQGALENEKQ